MTVGQLSGGKDRQRGFLGAFLLMLALVVGQFVTLERKISFRAAADPAVSRAAADKATGSTRPLSAGGGSNGSDSWHLTASATERRAAKAKATGGGDPWPELGLPLSSRPAPLVGLVELARLALPDAAVHSAAPRHHFDGRAPPQAVL